jgi:putative tricarboxylic transport membrane protein
MADRRRGVIRNPQDFYGGLVLIAIAILGFWALRRLPGQQGFAFGPGTAPRLFAGLLAACGALVAFIGLTTDGPKVERYRIRGPVLVTAAVFLFAGMIRPFGLVITTFLAVVVAASASDETRPVEILIWAAVLTLFCVLLFAYALNLPLALWPRFLV